MIEMPKTMTVQEVAEFARCHHQTVRRAIREGKLPAFRRDTGGRGRVLVLQEDAIKWALGGTTPEKMEG